MIPWGIITFALLKRNDRVHLPLAGILTVTMILSYKRTVLKDKLPTQEITDLSPQMEAVTLHTLEPIMQGKVLIHSLLVSKGQDGWEEI